MNLAYYVLVFDRGTDAWLELAGLGGAYRARSGQSVFAVETHTQYQREVGAGAALDVRTRLAAFDGKRLHLMHEMRSAGAAVAVQEALFLHVSLQTRRPVAMDADSIQAVAALLTPPEALPSWLGRHVGQPR